jgi:alkanesulfonate monooxygenase SsuD/methylene tetrahydromethanopterin reductase-like flavin-dependent oxidoreductase (luciferase family)
MEESLTLIKRVWEEDVVDFDGAQATLRGFTLFPRPRQRPRPLIYMGALADAPIRRAARFADGYVISAGSTIEDATARARVYRAAERELGLDPARRLPLAINRVVHVVGSRRERDDALPVYARGFLSFYDRWGHGDVRQLDAGERAFAETARSHFIFGEPSECIEQIQRYAEIGIGHLACMMSFGVRDVAAAERSLTLFAERVLPHCAAG